MQRLADFGADGDHEICLGDDLGSNRRGVRKGAVVKAGQDRRATRRLQDRDIQGLRKLGHRLVRTRQEDALPHQEHRRLSLLDQPHRVRDAGSGRRPDA